MVQREGRILRKGNTCPEVFIFRYITEGSFDAYSWQILENKQRFISAFLAGTANAADAEDISFSFLCEADGKVGTLALAKMLGKALDNPEDRVDEVLRQRVKSLERLGITLDVKDEPLLLEMETISNENCPARHGNYSVICHLHGNYFETVFDVDAFESKHDAEEWVSYYFDTLENVGIEFKII